ncbi:ABC transporter ATP-binding protein [Tumebacillus flagellatus]|uniref:ABC transporter ATP-binding protein n=1 Tax=Tumebacillus flagellatus TaxID=1157490 RepID=A0A074LMY1_9BACL|nr:ABC transporter ATP-binding protein [Tumebacillus flagellatus]KEO81880.1 ABC transporter ATP-binding protein [Tumebacillus flagellatus]
MKHVLDLQNVRKSFGSKNAVEDLSLTVEPGTVLSLLGPNGAGKTTTVSLMLGLLKPTSGTIRLLGGDPRDARTRQRVGAMLQEVSAIERLNVRETIELFRSFYEKPLTTDKLLEIAGLHEHAKTMGTALSGGLQRRLNFALAMAGNPDVLFLDEPTVGMDVSSRTLFWEHLREFANQGKTILLTTHYLEEADAISDRVVVIANGRITADGTPGELKNALGKRFITFRAGDRTTDALLQQLPGVDRIERSGRQVRLQVSDSDAALFAIVRNGLDVQDIEVKGGGLEDVFRSLTETGEGVKAS